MRIGERPMKVLTASQAISPAIDRTRRILFQPFLWRDYLKLAAVACITEGFTANSNLNFSHHHSSSPSVDTGTIFHLPNEVIALIALAVVAGLAIGIVVCYLVTRLRFAFFHCLVSQTREIVPGWRLYREQAWRFFTFSLLLGLVMLCIFAAVLIPFGFMLFDLFRGMPAGAHPDWPHLIGLLLLFIPVMLLLCFVAWVVKVVLHDFMLPHVALDNASIGEAWNAALSRVEVEKGRFFVYLLLRLLLPLLAMMALFLVLAIPLVIVFGILALATGGFNWMLADATGWEAVIRIAGDVFFGVVALGIGLFVGFSLGGPIATWIRNFALVFYGGRYQALGDLLDPPPPTPPSPHWSAPPDVA
jgi:MFS family permease